MENLKKVITSILESRERDPLDTGIKSVIKFSEEKRGFEITGYFTDTGNKTEFMSLFDLATFLTLGSII